MIGVYVHIFYGVSWCKRLNKLLSTWHQLGNAAGVLTASEICAFFPKAMVCYSFFRRWPYCTGSLHNGVSQTRKLFAVPSLHLLMLTIYAFKPQLTLIAYLTVSTP